MCSKLYKNLGVRGSKMKCLLDKDINKYPYFCHQSRNVYQSLSAVFKKR